jgi:hypothetical protein
MSQERPPTTIDGAAVLHYAVIDRGGPPHSNPERGSMPAGEAAGLAICSYDGMREDVYLFYCDRAWRVIADFHLESEERAKEYAGHTEDRGDLPWHRFADSGGKAGLRPGGHRQGPLERRCSVPGGDAGKRVWPVVAPHPHRHPTRGVGLPLRG